MAEIVDSESPRTRRLFAASALFVAVGVLCLAELALLSLAYMHDFTFECRARAPVWFCQSLSSGVIRAITVLGAGGLVLAARPAALRALAAHARVDMRWLALHVFGVALALAPWVFLADDSSRVVFLAAIMLWLGGLAFGTFGLALALAPAAAWADAFRVAGVGAVAIAVAAALSPEIAAVAQTAWRWPGVAAITFGASEGMLHVLGLPVFANSETRALGVQDFGVLVGPQCSGVEGFALITGFIGGYLWLFRDSIRFPHALVLFPIGLLLSWVFNVARIVILILIGEFVSPDLAINGFHSHAGWLMFTLISIGLATAVHLGGWFRREPAPVGAVAATPAAVTALDRPPFFQDPIVAQILPFAVFMASALIASTFFSTPALAYPLRAAAMAAALALVWRPLAAMDWRPGWQGPLVGLIVGLAWLATAPPPAESDHALATALAAAPPVLAVAWAVVRVLGTIALVPLIEELFFRGYVLARLDGDGWGWRRVAAVLISAGLFAALHDRWIAALLAGIAFAALALWRGRLAEAVAAHVVANAVIAASAVASGDWSKL